MTFDDDEIDPAGQTDFIELPLHRLPPVCAFFNRNAVMRSKKSQPLARCVILYNLIAHDDNRGSAWTSPHLRCSMIDKTLLTRGADPTYPLHIQQNGPKPLRPILRNPGPASRQLFIDNTASARARRRYWSSCPGRKVQSRTFGMENHPSILRQRSAKLPGSSSPSRRRH